MVFDLHVHGEVCCSFITVMLAEALPLSLNFNKIALLC